MSNKNVRSDITWLRSLFNGVISWVLAIFVYMIPGFIIATKIGFSLGRQGYESATISTEISQHMSEIYQNSIWLSILLILSICLFIVWRSRVVTKKHGGNGKRNGLLIATFPIMLAIVMLFVRFEWIAIIEIVLYSGAGYLSGMLFNVEHKLKDSQAK